MIPAPQRPSVGAEVKVPPLAVPQRELIVEPKAVAPQSELIPPGRPVLHFHSQFPTVLVGTSLYCGKTGIAVPLLQRLFEGAVLTGVSLWDADPHSP